MYLTSFIYSFLSSLNIFVNDSHFAPLNSHSIFCNVFLTKKILQTYLGTLQSNELPVSSFGGGGAEEVSLPCAWNL